MLYFGIYIFKIRLFFSINWYVKLNRKFKYVFMKYVLYLIKMNNVCYIIFVVGFCFFFINDSFFFQKDVYFLIYIFLNLVK